MAVENVELYLVLPKEATNLVTNPSGETGTTGHVAFGTGAVLSSSSTYQRRGVTSFCITPQTNQSAWQVYEIPLTDGVQYTFSVDVLDVLGLTFSIYFADAAYNVLSSVTQWTGTGYWTRRAVTYTAAATTNHLLMVKRLSNPSVTPFYTDGWLCEIGTESTYFDGDSKGFSIGVNDYLWLGTPHASQSWRSGQTRSGGTLLRLKDYMKVIGIVGLGMASIINNATPTSADFSIYQNTRINEREINIVGAFNGLTPGAMQANRKTLIDAVKPDLVSPQQPLMMRYQGKTSAGLDASEPVNIPVVYQSGLEGSFTTPGIEKVNLQFRQYMPLVQGAFEAGAQLGYETDVSNFANIGFRDVDGVWTAMGTGAAGGSAGGVLALARGSDGGIYAGGNFTSMGGVADTQSIAKWVNGAWEDVGNGVTAGTAKQVIDIKVGPDGKVYACGAFTQMGGVANTSGIAVWDGSNWSALGTGLDVSAGYGFTMVFDKLGNLYVGGQFSSAGGVANTHGIAMWDGSVWSSLGGGVSAGTSVGALVIGSDGDLYAGGTFLTIDSVADTARIARYDGADWFPLSTGADSSVSSLAVDLSGNLILSGQFTTLGGISINRIGIWNGVSFAPIGEGFGNNQVSKIIIDKNGKLFASGTFTLVEGRTFPDRIAEWNGTNWLPEDVDVNYASANITAMLIDNAGQLYIGGNWDTTTALSATVDAPSVSGATVYPVITFVGPGTVWQVKSYTTGKAIYFDDLTLLSGETAILNLRQGQISFVSSFRGSLMSYITPGSVLDFPLLPGDNNISSFMTDTDTPSDITMRWTPQYWSIDQAAR